MSMPTVREPAADRTTVSGRWSVVATGSVLLAVLVVVVVAALAGTRPYALLGIPDPGVLVRYGTPILRFAADAAGTVCVGALAFAACFGGGEAPVRSAGRWATGWCLAAALLVPFTTADLTGQPLAGPPSSVTVSTSTGAFGQWTALEQPLGWLLTAGLALVLAVACRLATRGRWALLVLAVLTALPPLATGHSSAGTGHDLATGAILVHVPAAMLWLGVLVALLRPGWRPADVTRRYRRLAGGCWLVLAASGLVDAAVLAPPGRSFDTAYGRLLAVKLVLVAALGVAGLLLRRRVRSVTRLAVAELVVLAGTMGVSVGLAHLPPPAFLGPQPTPLRLLLGYDLAGPPTLARLALDWRVDVFFGPLAVLLAVAYLVAVRRLPERWPIGRTVAWLVGCAVLLVATSSGIGRYAPAMFSVHIAAHMLIAMLAPLLLSLGGPLTLLDRLAPGRLRAASESAVLRAAGESAVLRTLTHPLVVLPLYAGAPFLLYRTGLFDAAARFHWAGMLIDAVFLVLGYLFAWTVIGVDALPRPLPMPGRLGVLLAAMPFDIVFGASVLGSGTVIGDGPASADLYSSLALPWVPDLLADQHTAGVLALVVGEATLLVALVVLVLRWQRLEQASEEDPVVTFGQARLG